MICSHCGQNMTGEQKNTSKPSWPKRHKSPCVAGYREDIATLDPKAAYRAARERWQRNPCPTTYEDVKREAQRLARAPE